MNDHTVISILTINNQDKETFKNWIEFPYSYMCCGKPHPYTKDKLETYLTNLQIMSAKKQNPCPVDLYFNFYVTESEIKPKSFFSKEKVIEHGKAVLELKFDVVLNEEEYKIWQWICQGIFVMLKSQYD